MRLAEIELASDRALKSLIASINPHSLSYGHLVVAAKAELDKRGVDYSDCVEEAI